MTKSVIINGVEVKVGTKMDWCPETNPSHRYTESHYHTVTKVMPNNICFDGHNSSRVRVTDVERHLRSGWWTVVE